MKPFSLSAVTERGDNHKSVVVALDADVWALLDQLLTFSDTDWMWSGDRDEIDELIGRANRELNMSALIGSIVWLAGPIPDTMLYCDGSSYDQADYPALYDALDSQYHSGTTFTVPDLVGQFVLGADVGELGETGGEEEVTLEIAQMPSHSHDNTPHGHTYTPPVLNLDLESPGVPDILGAGMGIPTSTGTSGITIDATGGDEAHNNMPPFVKLWPCIVAF